MPKEGGTPSVPAPLGCLAKQRPDHVIHGDDLDSASLFPKVSQSPLDRADDELKVEIEVEGQIAHCG
jgi:hypothetical protein